MPDMPPKERKAIIIGAGLTGLTTAFYLKKQGFDVSVLDILPQAGGVIQTHREKGFVFESGPNTGVLGNPETVELFRELEGLCELETANPAAKSRWIWKGKQWEPLPSGLWEYVRTPLFAAKDKLRLFAEPWQKKGTDPNETLDRLVLRRLGKSFLDYAVDPFVAGVYAGDAGYLVPRFALPKLYNLEQNHGSFIRGAIARHKQPKSERDKLATREVFSAKNGLGSLIGAMVERIGKDNLVLGCHGISVDCAANTDGSLRYIVKGHGNGLPIHIDAPWLVTTSGAHSLPDLLPFTDPMLLQPFDELVYAKVVQVILGFEHWQGIPINAFGGLVPSREKRDILGALFTSSFFENRAPKGGALLSVFLGGMRQPAIFGMTDEAIMQLVEKELTDMLDIPCFNPSVARIFRYHHAIPQYGASTEQRLLAVSAIENNYPGLVIGGNLRDGIGMADRIKQGRNIAEDLGQR
ncbi:MAG: protoporphyrinogen oxidase [Breznakibacter sp.]